MNNYDKYFGTLKRARYTLLQMCILIDGNCYDCLLKDVFDECPCKGNMVRSPKGTDTWLQKEAEEDLPNVFKVKQ